MLESVFKKEGEVMEDKRNLHMKVQELCDCFATTDPLKEMSLLPRDKDKDEAALKWLALAALHAVNDGASKISLIKNKDGKVSVWAKYREAELPSPGAEIGEKIIEAVRKITHLEGEKGKETMALGIRNDSLEIRVKVEKDQDKELIKLKFPA
jgi:hypothetical protein